MPQTEITAHVELPRQYTYWHCIAATPEDARAAFERRFPHYQPPAVYRKGIRYWFVMEWDRP